ncbi:MAG: prolyl oligopeptidase family serine peptidase, partial [Candidatus Hydrogenedentes bacterium]|nr:prolyl oligopeptidase family serine peptidase [Candidatus Hydrogenedentota bacterium]
DYARINQFPEWFTADGDRLYRVTVEGQDTQVVPGSSLWNWPVTLAPGGELRVTIATVESSPRRLALTPKCAATLEAWQTETRAALVELLKAGDALDHSNATLQAKELTREDRGSYWLRTVELDASPVRRMRALVGIPKTLPARKAPAVVCIHGHGGTAESVYDGETAYKGFAAVLASQGYITIAADVGQHDVYEEGRTLLGERLADLVRCVDYLRSRSWVDPDRIGCAGLSLGGEMAMWLGALDTRVRATVSAGFLTMMDQMEQNHCMCWKLEGLRDLVDFPDIYSLIAPRALQCQIGRKEPATQFSPALAVFALRQIQPAYKAAAVEDALAMDLHDGGHEVDLPALLAFFDKYLRDSRM